MKQIIILFIAITAFSCTSEVKKQVVPTFEHKTMYINASGGLRMRSTPDLKGQKLLTIPNNSKILVINEKGNNINLAGRTGKWSNVDYNGKKGWVFGGFLFSKKAFSKLQESQKIKLKKSSFEIIMKAPFDPDGTQNITLNKESNKLILENVGMGDQCSSFAAGGALVYTTNGFLFSSSFSDCNLKSDDGDCDQCFTKSYNCAIPLNISNGTKTVYAKCKLYKRVNNY